MTATLTELKARASSRRRVLDSEFGQAKFVVQQFKDTKAEVDELVDKVEVYEKTNILLNSLGEDKQDQAQKTIEELVTRGLQKIFDSSLSFHMIQNTKAKSATVEFVIRNTLPDGTMFDTDVMEARGGGLSATVGFLLRLVILLLKEGTNKPLFMALDETFAHVSEEYLEPLGEFLRELIDKTGIQIVMVTHQPEFAEFADVVNVLSNVDGKTVIKKVKDDSPSTSVNPA